MPTSPLLSPRKEDKKEKKERDGPERRKTDRPGMTAGVTSVSPSPPTVVPDAREKRLSLHLPSATASTPHSIPLSACT